MPHGTPPPPPPGDGGDLTRVGVECILNPHLGTGEMFKQPHPVHAEITVQTGVGPTPGTHLVVKFPTPGQSEAVKSPVVSRGGGGGGLQLLGALLSSICNAPCDCCFVKQKFCNFLFLQFFSGKNMVKTPEWCCF